MQYLILVWSQSVGDAVAHPRLHQSASDAVSHGQYRSVSDTVAHPGLVLTHIRVSVMQ